MHQALKLSQTTKYAMILIFIALTSLASFVITKYLIESNIKSALLINKAGLQRMYSQRVASFSLQYVYGHDNARQMLLQTIKSFEQNNTILIGIIQNHQEPLIFRLSHSDIQTNPYILHDIESSVKNYLSIAKKIASLSQDDPAIKPLLNSLLLSANNSMLMSLDNAVTWEQKHAESHFKDINNAQRTSFIALMLTILIGVLTVFRPMVKNSSYLMQIANVDSLTGALTRRAFYERAHDELARAQRYNKPLSILAIDVDYFKKINDTFGHGGGDAALVALTKHIQDSLRNSDFLGRWGGEEFMIFLSETDIEEALVVAERYRVSLSLLKIPYAGKTIQFKVSIGVSGLSNQAFNLERLINNADEALYQAKGAGRNCVIQYQEKVSSSIKYYA